VLVLSRETGQDVRDADGRVIGKLRDLTARLGVEHPVVYRLAIGARRRIVYLVPWTAVAAFERSEVQLRDVGPLDRFLIRRGEISLEEDELLLVRDVLDTLTERERQVLEQRFGLVDGYSRTLEEVGRQFKVTRERIRQIEAKALRKMRHPTRIRQLEGFLEAHEN